MAAWSAPSTVCHFAVARGQTLGIVGESGSGKSVTGLAILGLHDPRRTDGHGRDPGRRRDTAATGGGADPRLRGRDMAMIFQDPLSALHPYYTVGRQIAEAYRVHHPAAARRQARQRAVEMLDRVGIPQPHSGSTSTRTSSPAACASGP